MVSCATRAEVIKTAPSQGSSDVNYYEHHIRDYDAATSHLTWDEDLAYSRLIRWYYRKEHPLPVDVKEVCRQVRATSKSQREAVGSVLREFFSLRDDGWHNPTCDDVIKRFKDGEPEREVKKANEENRLRRHRDERARLFKILTDAGEHASWNIKMEDLREMVARVSGDRHESKLETPITAPATPATRTETAPATPATATQSPDTNHQTPVVNPSEAKASGGKPPLITDPDEIIFSYGVPLLVSAGATDKSARSFLGGLRKAHGDTALVDKLRECVKSKPLQPLEWLAAALPPVSSGKVSPIRTPLPENFKDRDYGERAKL